jgi:tetratricopeptide (TPR) repeat protein
LDRGRAELANNQAQAAKADFDQALKLKPDDLSALIARAELSFYQNDPKAARADLQAADRLAAGDSDARLAIAEAYRVSDLFEEEIAELDPWIAAHARDPRTADALEERCAARSFLGRDLDKALTDCDAALAIDPDEPSVLASRALVRLKSGNFGAAIDDYSASLKLMPHDAWSLYGRGLARLKMGQTAEAQVDIQAATALDPHIAQSAKAWGIAP